MKQLKTTIFVENFQYILLFFQHLSQLHKKLLFTFSFECNNHEVSLSFLDTTNIDSINFTLQWFCPKNNNRNLSITIIVINSTLHHYHQVLFLHSVVAGLTPQVLQDFEFD